MDDEIESILCLIDELKSEDHNTRLHAINNLHLISEAIGPERTQEELVPYIVELLEDDNEEVLIALANKLGELKNYFNENRQLGCLMNPLQILAGNEEDAVRDKATASFNLVSADMDQATTEEFLLPVLQNLAGNDMFSARIAACHLFHSPFDKLRHPHEDDLIKLFCDLGKDDTPMVRRAAAQNLSNMYFAIGNEKTGVLKKVFIDLSSDENDSVRMNTLNSLVDLLQREDWVEEVIKKFSKDKSWRVRYAFIECLNKLNDQSSSQFVDNVTDLLKDAEPEVRCAAVTKLDKLFGRIDQQAIMSQILPVLDGLVEDKSSYVKLSLVQVLCTISRFVGGENTVIKILPMINKLLRDENYEIKVKFLAKVHEFNQSLGNDKIQIFAIPLLQQLVKDQQWRVRVKVVEYIPELALLMGIDQFNQKMLDSFLKWVEDPVYSIREQVFKSFSTMGKHFGNNWIQEKAQSIIQELSQNKNFTKRQTALLGIKLLGKQLEDNFVMNILMNLSNDPVPNIRIVVVKIINEIYPNLPNKNAIKSALQELSNNDDNDVKFFATKALQELRL